MSEMTYSEGLLGKKIGMTQVFTTEGQVVGVTVIQVGPCTVLDVRNKDQHGYNAVQFGFGEKKQQRVDKAMLGHFVKAGKGAFYHVRELRLDSTEKNLTPGQEVRVSEVFNQGDLVDITGTSIGRGFAGVVKKFKVKGQPYTRGTHEYRRHIGSIGCRKFPGRVFKNKKMPGHLGDSRVTVQNLQVVAVNPEENLLLIRGGIPGAKGSLVVVRKGAKKYRAQAA